MSMEDYICSNFKYLKQIEADCCSYALYKCKRTGEVFDQFHDKCEGCKYDTEKD